MSLSLISGRGCNHGSDQVNFYVKNVKFSLGKIKFDWNHLKGDFVSSIRFDLIVVVFCLEQPGGETRFCWTSPDMSFPLIVGHNWFVQGEETHLWWALHQIWVSSAHGSQFVTKNLICFEQVWELICGEHHQQPPWSCRQSRWTRWRWTNDLLWNENEPDEVNVNVNVFVH